MEVAVDSFPTPALVSISLRTNPGSLLTEVSNYRSLMIIEVADKIFNDLRGFEK